MTIMFMENTISKMISAIVGDIQVENDVEVQTTVNEGMGPSCEDTLNQLNRDTSKIQRPMGN